MVDAESECMIPYINNLIAHVRHQCAIRSQCHCGYLIFYFLFILELKFKKIQDWLILYIIHLCIFAKTSRERSKSFKNYQKTLQGSDTETSIFK